MLSENPTDSFLQHALALEYIKTGNDDRAKEIFEQLLTTNTNYVGSYYHLAKLHERQGALADAIKVYEQGIEVAHRVGDVHSLNELKSAYEFLTF